MQKPQPYTARLEDRIEHNEKYLELHFELIEPFRMEFAAGQYVSIKVSDKGHRRSYSISSRPDIDHGFHLLIDVEPQGVGTTFLKNLQPGDQIEFLGPLGHFVLADDPTEEQLVFVATGSGVAPFKSMLLYQLQVHQDQRPMTLYWGMRHVEQLFWEDEFQELSEHFPNFKFHPVISKPIPEWSLCRGRVTDCLSIHQFPEQAGFYLCGNQAMIEQVTKFLQEKGVPQANVHFEKFF